MVTHRFWIAALLSGCLHTAALASLCVIAFWSDFPPPVLLETWGDSDREGFPSIDAVALVPGTFLKGDEHTPGGDEGPQKKTRDSTPPPAEPEPAESAATPVIPPPAPVEEKPVPSVQESPLPAFPTQKPPEPPKPRDESTTPPRAADKPSPSEQPPAAGNSNSTGSQLPGARGGSQFPPGTPSAGGTVGSQSGIRAVKGTRPPRYPYAAREDGIEGTVVLWLRVSAEGAVVDARVHKSSGYKILDAAALRWAWKQKFVPPRVGQTPVEWAGTKPVNFGLD